MRIYKNKLFGFFLRNVRSEDLASDLFQETLIKVWKGLFKYNEKSKFSSWLFAIAYNVLIDYKRKTKNELFINYDELNFSSNNENPLTALIADEEMKMLLNKVDKLPDKQKQVFLLRTHGDLSFKEISELTKESLNTVLSHMHYAVKKIRIELKEKENV